jgi:hypothetical protein
MTKLTGTRGELLLLLLLLFCSVASPPGYANGRSWLTLRSIRQLHCWPKAWGYLHVHWHVQRTGGNGPSISGQQYRSKAGQSHSARQHGVVEILAVCKGQ